MGTRCLTVFVNSKSEKETCVLYRQYDGYVAGGHGHELAEFLSSAPLVNGLQDESPAFNGFDNLVAQTIGHFDASEGGFCVHPPGTRDIWEEYTYTVRACTPMDGNRDAPIEIVVHRGKDEIFRGTPKSLCSFEEPSEDDE
jgi:hypothetical protein